MASVEFGRIALSSLADSVAWAVLLLGFASLGTWVRARRPAVLLAVAIRVGKRL